MGRERHQSRTFTGSFCLFLQQVAFAAAGDIKLENLMLARQEDLSSVKIADMGFAALVSKSDKTIETMAGTPAYLAPEMVDVITRKPGAVKKFTCASPESSTQNRKPQTRIQP